MTYLSQTGCPDLLLSDVCLAKDQTGFDLARKARHIFPQIKVLYMSGFADPAFLRHQTDDDQIECLSKPFSRQKLLEAVTKLLRD